jgi:hypothetical protein
MISWFKSLFSKKNQKKSVRALDDDAFRDLKISREKKLNKILDKISKGGYESLNQNEKNFLKNIGEF